MQSALSDLGTTIFAVTFLLSTWLVTRSRYRLSVTWGEHRLDLRPQGGQKTSRTDIP